MCNKENWKEGRIEENPIWSKVSKLHKLAPFSIVDWETTSSKVAARLFELLDTSTAQNSKSISVNARARFIQQCYSALISKQARPFARTHLPLYLDVRPIQRQRHGFFSFVGHRHIA